jgi:hypothetical protein
VRCTTIPPLVETHVKLNCSIVTVEVFWEPPFHEHSDLIPPLFRNIAECPTLPGGGGEGLKVLSAAQRVR